MNLVSCHRQGLAYIVASGRGLVVLALGLLWPVLGFVLEASPRAVLSVTLSWVFLWALVCLAELWSARRLVTFSLVQISTAEVGKLGVAVSVQLRWSILKFPIPTRVFLRLDAPANWDVINGTLARNELRFAPESTTTLVGNFLYRPQVRGGANFSALHVRICQGLGFCWSQFRLVPSSALTIRIVPNDQNEDSEMLALSPRALQGRANRRIQAQGYGEFESLRPYAVGDDLRHVEWKHSAKTDHLIVKQYRPDTHQRILLAIDCSRRLSARIQSRRQLDYTIDMAAMLIRLSVASDDEVGLFAFHHAEVALQEPGRAKRWAPLLQSTLTDLQPGSLDPDYGLITARLLAVPRRTLVVVLTSLANPASVDHIRDALLPLRDRHLVLVVSLSDEELERIALSTARQPIDAWLIAAAQEQRESVQTRLDALRHHGIHAIHGARETLPKLLYETYYDLKTSAQW